MAIDELIGDWRLLIGDYFYSSLAPIPIINSPIVFRLFYNDPMPGRQCFHCKQWIEEEEAHDCWTTTEEALTADLSDDLKDAWERLRETAADFGEQRIYASHHSIMFSRKSCYFFVRPRRSYLELCVFLGRTVKAPQIRRVDDASKSKRVHFIQIRHRDEVEAPITDWLQEAYEFCEVRAQKAAASKRRPRRISKSRRSVKGRK